MRRDHFQVITSDGEHVAILGEYETYADACIAGAAAVDGDTEWYEVYELPETSGPVPGSQDWAETCGDDLGESPDY